MAPPGFGLTAQGRSLKMTTSNNSAKILPFKRPESRLWGIGLVNEQERTGPIPKLLVVDDEVLVGEDLAESLHAMGYGVVGVARSGADAILLAEKESPDLVLMDIKLQGEMDGIEAAATIRGRFRTPVVFVSAYNSDAILERVKRTEAFGYLVKPFSEKDLRSAIELALYRNEMERRLEERSIELEKTNERLRREVADRERAQEALRQREARFRGYFEVPLIGMATTGPDKRWVEVNRKLCDILGRTAGELTRMTWAQMTHSDDLAVELDYFSQVMAGAIDGYSLEKRFLGREGEAIHSFVSTRSVRNRDGSVNHFVAVIRDIPSWRSDLGRGGQISEDLANHTYRLMNDLGTPLTKIKRCTGDVKRAVETLDTLYRHRGPVDNGPPMVESLFNHDIPEAVGLIESSASRMESMIEAITRLHELERMELSFEWLEMNALLYEVLRTLDYEKDFPGARISVGPLPGIVGDRDALRRIIDGLVGNALSSLDPTRPGRIEISGRRSGEDVLFSVKDNGRGIDSLARGKLFDAFHGECMSSHNRKGVDLASVKTLVQRHGGRVWCESESGVGSTFTFAISGHILEGLTILCIDDVEAMLKLMFYGLTEHNHTVIPALSGEDGLDQFVRRNVDLVICDLGMPGMNGWEVGKRIKELCEERDIPKPPFIILTGWAGQLDETDKIIEAGVDRIMEKPLDVQRVQDLIRDVMRERRARPL